MEGLRPRIRLFTSIFLVLQSVLSWVYIAYDCHACRLSPRFVDWIGSNWNLDGLSLHVLRVSYKILESSLGEEDAWWWVASQARKDVVCGVREYK